MASNRLQAKAEDEKTGRDNLGKEESEQKPKEKKKWRFFIEKADEEGKYPSEKNSWININLNFAGASALVMLAAFIALFS
jgi:hypothetical protein